LTRAKDLKDLKDSKDKGRPSFGSFESFGSFLLLASLTQLDEDIVQEVFTQVWTRAASFNPARGDAAGWLYTLTRNKVIDLWRRSSKGGPAEEIDDRRLAARREEDDLRLTLRQALSRVPPEQRQAIEMAYFDGFTYQETAQELDLPEGTLKSRIRLGLKTMKSVLTQGRRAAN
jgi:RNA polymerase sigma-70 factor (ECF subfamily)